MTTDGLIFALPSKGSLHDPMVALFERCFLKPKRDHGGRSYSGRLQGIEGSTIIYARADDVAEIVGTGQAHVGVTGLDLVMESQPADFSDQVGLVVPDLGFGRASLTIGVPNTWIDVRSFSDLIDVAHEVRLKHQRPLRIATKFPHLTRSFFMRHGLSDFRLVASAGATEAAPRSGTADCIVDLVSSGTTYVANGLTAIDGGVVLDSQAALVANNDANRWTPNAIAAFEHFGSLLSGGLRAEAMRTIQTTLPAGHTKPPAELQDLLSDVHTFITTDGATAVSAVFHTDNVHEVLSRFRRQGACGTRISDCHIMADMGDNAFDQFLAELT